MISLLRWIWGAIKAIGKRLFSLFGVLWDLLQHGITWFLAGIVYLLHQISTWVCDAINSSLSGLANSVTFQGGPLENVPALAQFVLHDFLAMDFAVELLVTFFAVWVSAKVARVAMIPIRAALDLL